MLGLMQQQPLLIPNLLEHAARFHSTREIVSFDEAGRCHRYTWGELARRVRRFANALSSLGIGQNHLVASLADNTFQHLELFYAVSGIGAVLHTLNTRHSASQLQYILNQAESSVLVYAPRHAKLVETLLPQCPSIKTLIRLGDNGSEYEELINGADEQINWPALDENTGSVLCYTTGTSGYPKGVLYSHRSTVLHAFSLCLPDSYCLSAASRFLLIVPLCHGTAWGLPYAAALTGAKLVLPGSRLDGEFIYRLLVEENITHTGAVPTVLKSLLDYVEETDAKPQQETVLARVVSGGSAVPRSLFEAFDRHFGEVLQQGWGMTELNPCGLHGVLLDKHANAGYGERLACRLNQGRPPFGVGLSIVSETGDSLPHDGCAKGQLRVAGPWTIRQYFKQSSSPLDKQGFFDTGDIATVDPDGYVRIVDRTKDVIKSGGEWISSVDIENTALGCEGIQQAAVIGIPHPKWQERPLLICVKTASGNATRESVLGYLKGHLDKWQIPEDVVFIDEMPLNAGGKLCKRTLRESFRT